MSKWLALAALAAFGSCGSPLMFGIDSSPPGLDVLVCGDKKAAREKVIELTEEAGMVGWHAGPVANSAAAEALTSILIQINRSGIVSHSGIKIIGQEH